jgi:hypothetical protein
MLAITPYVILSLEKRMMPITAVDNYDERAAFTTAAMMMLSDHPMGVGANNFVVIANSKGYFERAGVAGVLGSRSANVHNAFLLAATETGYLGLFTFILMLAHPVILASRYGWRARGDKRGDLLLGLAFVLVLVYVHSLFEWVFFLFWFQYTFAVALGLIAGLTNQLRYERLNGKPALAAARRTRFVQRFKQSSRPI